MALHKVMPKCAIVLFGVIGICSAFSPHASGLSDAFLRQMVDRMGNDLADPERGYLDIPSRGLVEPTYPESRPISARDMKESIMEPMDYSDIIPMNRIRDPEYLQHSSLFSSMIDHFIPGDTKFRLKPLSNKPKLFESKSDGVLPAYCNPPNPCPVGYTEADGCLEEFKNTATFSREYQSMQDCMCDTEHMFECQDSTRESEINALARSIQNEGVLDDALHKIMGGMNSNPYLKGEKLPIAAKKGNV